MLRHQDLLNASLPLFCPCKSCPYYQSLDNPITKHGTYPVKSDVRRRQRLYCHGGKHRFSETAYSHLYGRHGSFKEYVQTAKMSCNGLGSDAIADILDRDPRTIEDWRNGLGEKSQRFHLYLGGIIGLVLQFLQLDELWSYLGRKKRQLWVFIALESDSKFWISFELGSRTNHTANRLVARLKALVRWEQAPLLRVTSDKLAAYKNALTNQLSTIPYVYLQIVKRRIKRRLATVKKCFVQGSATDFPGKTQNTSYIERINLTLRQRVCYLQRKTLGYCKRKTHFSEVMWINLFDYNYCQYHKSLRLELTEESAKFKRRYQHQTPAMRMGLTKAQLDWYYLMVAPIPRRS